MEREYLVGDHVIYVDEFGKRHNGIVTTWWDNYRNVRFGDSDSTKGVDLPGCNLVFVTADPKKTDGYGSQIERPTSVVHRKNQAANGRYWIWPDEA